MEERFVNPGEKLSMEEEYAASENTYVEDGTVYAASTGMLVVKDGAISVMPLRDVRKIERGMMVVGRVTDAMKSVIFVAIDRVSSSNKEYFALKDGKIILRQQRQFDRGGRGRPPFGDRGVRREPRESEEKPCRTGDTVVARVLAEENDTYVLSLNTPEAGVVYSMCSMCGNPMELGDSPNVLYCHSCRRGEHKKVSSYYGKPEEIKKYFDNGK